MKRARSIAGTLVLGLTLFALWTLPQTARAFEGVVHTKKITVVTVPMMGERRQESEETVYYKPGFFKVVDPERGNVTIVNLDKGLIWQIDLNKKTYFEMTFDQLAQMQEQASAKMKEVQQRLQTQLQGMPEDKRQMIEQMLGKGTMKALAQGKLEFTWKSTKEKQTINGYPCRKYIPLLNGEPIGEVWVTDKFNLGDDVSKYVQALRLFGKQSFASEPPFKGLPIKTVIDMQMGPSKTHSESTVVKVEEKSIPDSEFALPSGLKKVEVPQGMPVEE